MKEPLCPEDAPERYAFMYLRPENEVEIFEKFKAFHDFCQEKNIPCLIIGLTNPDDMMSCFALHHFHNNAEEWSAVDLRGRGILWANQCFLKTVTNGHYQIQPVTAEGEEWKK